MIYNNIKYNFSYLYKTNKIITDNFKINKLSDISLNTSFNILSYNIDNNKFEFKNTFITHHNNYELDDITLTSNSNIFIYYKLLFLNDKFEYIENHKLSYNDNFIFFTIYNNNFKLYKNKYISNRFYHSKNDSIKINLDDNFCLVFAYDNNMISGIIVK
jgi:hypothetical protein